MTWTPNLRMPKYSQVMVFPRCLMKHDDLDAFEAFMKEHLGSKHPTIPIGCVFTAYDYDSDTGGRSDFMFLVHDEDASNWDFCTRRFQFGLRWLEDVRGNDPKIYPKDFAKAYPSTW